MIQMKLNIWNPIYKHCMEMCGCFLIFVSFWNFFFQADDCKCNGWKTPIPPAKSPRVDVSQPLASFTDPCRSCTHVLGMECNMWEASSVIYLSMKLHAVTCLISALIKCQFTDSNVFRVMAHPLQLYVCQCHGFGNTWTLISVCISHKRKQTLENIHGCMATVNTESSFTCYKIIFCCLQFKRGKSPSEMTKSLCAFCSFWWLWLSVGCNDGTLSHQSCCLS